MNQRQQAAWVGCIEKENHLRLKWFKKNEARLESYVNRDLVRTVPADVLKEQTDNRRELLEQTRMTRTKYSDPLPAVVDPAVDLNIMKPVNPKITKILYGDGLGDGRVSYLKERVKLKPDDRYYFPECMSYVYGWKMWNYSKENPMVRYGKTRIVQTSFYRRRGVEGDPEWYKEPQRLSPTVCGS